MKRVWNAIVVKSSISAICILLFIKAMAEFQFSFRWEAEGSLEIHQSIRR